MQCPIDGTTLAMTERSGIEIDYCPQCRGVWLDRGELDKILERGEQTVTEVTTSKPIPSQEYFKPSETRPLQEGPNYRDDDQRYRTDYDKDHYDPRNHKRHKKESFLSDLFDF